MVRNTNTQPGLRNPSGWQQIRAKCILRPFRFMVRVGLGLGVLFLYRLGLALGLWSVLTFGEWFGGTYGESSEGA